MPDTKGASPKYSYRDGAVAVDKRGNYLHAPTVGPERSFAAVYPYMIHELGLSDTPLLVYAVIAGFRRSSDGREICFASRKYLSEMAGCSQKSVTRAIADLEEAGYIEVWRSTQRDEWDTVSTPSHVREALRYHFAVKQRKFAVRARTIEEIRELYGHPASLEVSDIAQVADMGSHVDVADDIILSQTISSRENNLRKFSTTKTAGQRGGGQSVPHPTELGAEFSTTKTAGQRGEGQSVPQGEGQSVPQGEGQSVPQSQGVGDMGVPHISIDRKVSKDRVVKIESHPISSRQGTARRLDGEMGWDGSASQCRGGAPSAPALPGPAAPDGPVGNAGADTARDMYACAMAPGVPAGEVLWQVFVAYATHKDHANLGVADVTRCVEAWTRLVEDAKVPPEDLLDAFGGHVELRRRTNGPNVYRRYVSSLPRWLEGGCWATLPHTEPEYSEGRAASSRRRALSEAARAAAGAEPDAWRAAYGVS